jgi:hypothetical protein
MRHQTLRRAGPAADAAWLDWHSALAIAGLDDLKITGLNGRYLDLLVRAAADELAIAEITSLTEQIPAADETFRGNLHLAASAAQALADPAREKIPRPGLAAIPE